jgi:hypothetical protein
MGVYWGEIRFEMWVLFFAVLHEAEVRQGAVSLALGVCGRVRQVMAEASLGVSVVMRFAACGLIEDIKLFYIHVRTFYNSPIKLKSLCVFCIMLFAKFPLGGAKKVLPVIPFSTNTLLVSSCFI